MINMKDKRKDKKDGERTEPKPGQAWQGGRKRSRPTGKQGKASPSKERSPPPRAHDDDLEAMVDAKLGARAPSPTSPAKPASAPKDAPLSPSSTPSLSKGSPPASSPQPARQAPSTTPAQRPTDANTNDSSDSKPAIQRRWEPKSGPERSAPSASSPEAKPSDSSGSKGDSAATPGATAATPGATAALERLKAAAKDATDTEKRPDTAQGPGARGPTSATRNDDASGQTTKPLARGQPGSQPSSTATEPPKDGTLPSASGSASASAAKAASASGTKQASAAAGKSASGAPENADEAASGFGATLAAMAKEADEEGKKGDAPPADTDPQRKANGKDAKRKGLRGLLKRGKADAEEAVDEPGDAAPKTGGGDTSATIVAGTSTGAGEALKEVPGAPMAADMGESPARGAVAGSKETREFLRNLKKQQELHLKAEEAEARELEERAKELAARVKAQRKRQRSMDKHADYVGSIADELGFDPERPVTTIPELTDPALREVERTEILEGRSYARVLFNEKRNRYEYSVVEPDLSQTETQVLDFLRDTLIRTMDGKRGDTMEEWEEQLLEAIDTAILDHTILIDKVAREKVEYYLLRDFLGYGPIDVLMRDPMVEDISCDGPNTPIFLFHRQYESVRTDVVFEDEVDLDSFVIRLGQRSGKHISIADPLLDATLPDKSRLQATLSREVTTRGSSFTIRRFRADPLTPPDLVSMGTYDPAMAAYFWFLMEEGNSLLLAGGTASGKTTSLNAAGLFIPPEKKIVSIEDTREINLPHENWIAGVTRSGFGGETAAGVRSGAISMFNLLAAALRQRPEYLLVGEVRGPEAQTLFQAMATGHATYSTVHADSVSSAVYRLENDPIKVPRMMLQTVDVIAVQVQARLGDRMVRRVREVVEIVGMDPETGDLLTNRVFEWDPATDEHRYFGNSHVLDQIGLKRAKSPEMIEEDWKNRTRVIRWMVGAGIRVISDVADVISAYYSRPGSLMEKVTEWERSERGKKQREQPAKGSPELPATHPNDPGSEKGAKGSPVASADAKETPTEPPAEAEATATVPRKRGGD